MSVDIGELKTTAVLAHLNMSEDALKKTHPSFEEMLGFFEAMKKADTDSEAFCTPINSLPVQTIQGDSEFFRHDELSANQNTAENKLNETLLDNCGEKDTNFFVVPNVL
ncbi:MAG: hypothetical protein Ta2G_11260 [Termitinemataceae bacterium]|nr:MAG: hypothetical protein Ta2G_11260 [Termitinemataceae bacterium]